MSSPDLEQLPKWMREALQHASIDTTSPKVESSAPAWPLLVDAAVVGSFLPQDLAPEALTGAARAQAERDVLGHAELIDQPDGARWSLTHQARQRILNEALKHPAAVTAALASTSTRFGDKLSTALRASLQARGQLDLEALDLAQLEARRTAMSLLVGVQPLDLPPLAAVDSEVERRRLLQHFKRMTGRFYGRSDELESLREYVGVVAADTLRQSFGRFTRNVGRFLGGRAPLVVWGIGGVGKTTLISKFMLEHAEAAAARYPFAYLDFDRPTISARDPVALFLEVCAQVSAQFPALGERLHGLQSHVLPLAARVSEGQSPAEATDLLGSYLFEFRLIVDLYLDEQESLFESARPFLLVFDTFEIVQYTPDSVDALQGFVQGFSGRGDVALWPRLRVILSGRQDVPYFLGKPEALQLGPLDRPGSIALLRELASEAECPISEKEAKLLVSAYAKASGTPRAGLHPLRLSLIGEVFKSEKRDAGADVTGSMIVASLVREVEDPGTQAGAGQRRLIEGLLVRRILGHVLDERVRALADPGLVVRYITRDVIRDVMTAATPEYFRQPVSDAEADSIFEAMKREVSLVRPEGNALRHRQDVRLEMLPLIRARHRERADEVHQRAYKYFLGVLERKPRQDKQQLNAAAAEAIYHGLWLGQSFTTLDRLWSRDPGFDPKLDEAEFAPHSDAHLFILAKTGQHLSPAEVRRLPRTLAHDWLAARQDRFLREAPISVSLEKIRAAAGKDYEDLDRQPKLAAVTTRLMYRDGLWRDARWLTQRFLPSPKSLADEDWDDAIELDGFVSLARTASTMMAKCAAPARELMAFVGVAQSMREPIIRTELLAHIVLGLLASGGSQSMLSELRAEIDVAAGDASPSQWRREIRILRLAVLASSGADPDLLQRYVRGMEQLPRERPAIEAADRVLELTAREPNRDLAALHRQLRLKTLPPQMLDAYDAMWRQQRDRVANAVFEGGEIMRQVRTIIAFDHYDWRGVLANALARALQSKGYDGLHVLREAGLVPRQSPRSAQLAASIIRSSVEQGRFLELARLLSRERDPWEDFIEDSALHAPRKRADAERYPQSADGLARALLLWHETLMLSVQELAPEPIGRSRSAPTRRGAKKK